MITFISGSKELHETNSTISESDYRTNKMVVQVEKLNKVRKIEEKRNNMKKYARMYMEEYKRGTMSICDFNKLVRKMNKDWDSFMSDMN